MTSIKDFKQVTDSLEVYPDELGVVMLDFEPFDNPGIPEEWMYYTSDPEQWWEKGFVGDRAHVSLKYGLLKKAYEWKDQIKLLTDGLPLPMATVVDTRVFQQPGEPYAAVVLEVAKDDALVEFHRRLSYLPHIDTFTPWVPHVTVAYVLSELAQPTVQLVNKVMFGKILTPKALNLGEEKY